MMFDIWSIARKRYRMRKALRTAAVGLMTGAIVFLGLVLTQFVVPGLAGGGGLISVALSILLPFLAGAGFLWVAERFWMRWLVPMPASGCPACGYALGNVIPARCSECGVDLGGRPHGASSGPGAGSA